MKNKLILLLLLLLPIQVMAYSNYVIPGGETIGIEVKTKGIMIIGFYKVNGKYNNGINNLKSGDYITKVNNQEVNNIKELTEQIEDNVNKEKILVTYTRNGVEKQTELSLAYSDNIYKTGLYVKDNITGIGTISYIDPETKIYGALGHEITESNTSSLVEIKSGTIFKNYITSIDKSVNGTPGSKNAKFEFNSLYGMIDKNTKYGIYGEYKDKLPTKELMKVASKDEVKIGQAKIQTVLKDTKVEEFNINITNIEDTNSVKNITFEITDKTLLDKTGGVVQGMSGSPIIQDNRLIGAVTHVMIDSVNKGYGIFITTMLEEGEN